MDHKMSRVGAERPLDGAAPQLPTASPFMGGGGGATTTTTTTSSSSHSSTTSLTSPERTSSASRPCSHGGAADAAWSCWPLLRRAGLRCRAGRRSGGAWTAATGCAALRQQPAKERRIAGLGSGAAVVQATGAAAGGGSHVEEVRRLELQQLRDLHAQFYGDDDDDDDGDDGDGGDKEPIREIIRVAPTVSSLTL